jgi:hypothetical protein
MGLKGPQLDPLDPESWWANDDGPVFSQSNFTVGTGHASFPRDAVSLVLILSGFQIHASQNGVPYITYHAWDVDAPAGWGSREVRTQCVDIRSALNFV